MKPLVAKWFRRLGSIVLVVALVGVCGVAVVENGCSDGGIPAHRPVYDHDPAQCAVCAGKAKADAKARAWREQMERETAEPEPPADGADWYQINAMWVRLTPEKLEEWRATGVEPRRVDRRPRTIAVDPMR